MIGYRELQHRAALRQPPIEALAPWVVVRAGKHPCILSRHYTRAEAFEHRAALLEWIGGPLLVGHGCGEEREGQPCK